MGSLPAPPVHDPRVLAAVLDSLPSHTAVLDDEGRIMAVSRSWRRFCLDNGGEESRCGVGSDYLAVCQRATGGDRDEALDVADGIRRVVSGAVETFDMDYECSSADERRWFQVSVVPLRDPSRAGRLGAVVSHSDITGRKLDELELVHEATHDPLTGLVNRTLLLAELRRELHRAQGEGASLALLFLDLDGFKAVNDTLGHDAGDRLLRATADRLRTTLRPEQHLARIGGDEFVVVLPRAGLAAARRTARRLAAVTREPVELDGLPVGCSSSIGIAVTDGTLTTAEELLAGADAAMYRAKRRGRARTEVFAGELRERTRRRADVETQLEVALHDGSLQLFRQPVVSLVDGTEVSSEALVRWFPHEGGLRSPDDFLSDVTHTRVRRAITRAVLVGAAGALAAGTRGPVSVNVALEDLRGATFVEDVEAAVRQTGCRPGQLVVEVAEAAAVADPRAVRRAVVRLRDLGVLAVVDQVTGAAPFQLLSGLPVDGLKLDRSIAAITRPSARALVRSLAVLSDDLGLTLAAVGVETGEQRRRLVDLGVAYGQGWSLGPPAPWALVGGDRPGTGPPGRGATSSGFAERRGDG